jgi:predicted nucleic acid-binding protein
MIILDTNIVSVLLVAGHADWGKLAAWQSGVPDQDMRITAITRAEIAQGIAILPDGAKKRGLAEAAAAYFAATAPVTLPFGALEADAYGGIVARRRAIGRPIAVLDAQIAAIALVAGATVATRDMAGFSDCGVDVINPYAEGGPPPKN